MNKIKQSLLSMLITTFFVLAAAAIATINSEGVRMVTTALWAWLALLVGAVEMGNHLLKTIKDLKAERQALMDKLQQSK